MEAFNDCKIVKMESYDKYNLAIQKITENILQKGDYKILNLATGVTWTVNDPYKIYDCLQKRYDYKVFGPEVKTEPEAKNDKKTKKE